MTLITLKPDALVVPEFDFSEIYPAMGYNESGCIIMSHPGAGPQWPNQGYFGMGYGLYGDNLNTSFLNGWDVTDADPVKQARMIAAKAAIPSLWANRILPWFFASPDATNTCSNAALRVLNGQCYVLDSSTGLWSRASNTTFNATNCTTYATGGTSSASAAISMKVITDNINIPAFPFCPTSTDWSGATSDTTKYRVLHSSATPGVVLTNPENVAGILVVFETQIISTDGNALNGTPKFLMQAGIDAGYDDWQVGEANGVLEGAPYSPAIAGSGWRLINTDGTRKKHYVGTFLHENSYQDLTSAYSVAGGVSVMTAAQFEANMPRRTYQQPYVIPGIASRHKRINPIPGVGHETPGVLASSQAQSVLRQPFTEGGSLLSAAALPARIDTGYPIVTFIGSTTFTVNSVDHIITLPTVSAGDGIIIVLTTDNDTSVTRPGEWDTLYNSSITGSLRGGAYAIVADGTESGTTVNFVTSSAEKGAAQVFKITNWNGTLAGIQYGVTATSTSGSTADLPAINAYWGSSKMVCIGILHTSTSQTVSSAPAGYTNLTTASSGTSTSDGQCITAVKSIEGATEDPGVFTMSGTGAAKIYNTLAICSAYAGMYYERFNITRSGTTLWAGLYSSQPYQTPDTNITRAIIVVHGKSLDAAEYGNVVNKNMANYLGKAIVIAPFFERNVERADVDQLFWGSSWPEGGRSSTLLPWKISSAEVMDLLIANLYSTFPNLEGVILCGHSAGGQYCNRYSALSNDTRNRYLVSAASSYLYPGAERPDGLGNWKIPESPSTYDDYKYGLQNLSGVSYANAIGAEEMRKRLRAAKVTYMVGALDNDPTSSSLDITANAMVQGLHRVSRQQNYHEYLQYWDLSQY